MILRIIHSKDGIYDVYDKISDKWLFSRANADNVLLQLARYGSIQIEFIDESSNQKDNFKRWIVWILKVCILIVRVVRVLSNRTYTIEGKQVGYVRLRWGILYCNYPDVDGEKIYTTGIGDGLTGRFESDEQRMDHLNNIADKILEKINM